jgi:hypothetical protein
MPSPSPLLRKTTSTPLQQAAPDLNALYAELHPMDSGPVKEEQPIFQMRVTDLALPKGAALRRLLSGRK